MAACAQNIKKIALILAQEGGKRLSGCLNGHLRQIWTILSALCKTPFQCSEKLAMPTEAVC